ncbi:MAG TPA: hypothetical protein VGW74_19555 [Propionibacteriaceae bacterium]|nr:hypothetical protein [Propionibacteriaceae bacterium]
MAKRRLELTHQLCPAAAAASRTLGGHRRYPEAGIREFVDVLRQEPTA